MNLPHLRRIVPIMTIAWRSAPLLLVLQIGVGAMSALVPIGVAWLTKLLIDRLGHGAPSALTAMAGLVVASAGMAIAPHVSRFLDRRCEYRATLYAQDILYRAVNRLPGLGRFEDPQFQDHLRYAQGSAGPTSSRVVAGGIQIVGGLLTAAGLLYSLALINLVTALFLAGSAVPVAVAEFLLARRRAALLWDLGPVERREFFFAGLITSLSAAKEVRLFGIGEYLRRRMRGERLRINAMRQRRDDVEIATQSGLGILAAGAAGAGLYWIVSAALHGTATLGDVAMFIAALAGAQSAVISLSSSLARTYEDLVVFEHFQAVVDVGPDLRLTAAPRPAGALRDAIELRDVWFRYSPEHQWILRGVNLRIPAGASLALVGRNGSGKSTLVKLLCRFYDPTRGQILWDGTDLTQFDPAELRDRISVVFQDFMHYDLTARENIALGDIGRLEDRAAIEQAARRMGCHDSIASLVHGYDTLLTRLFMSARQAGDPASGVILSGGQWQRLALARALLRGRRDLLILDEPSSGLDAISEANLYAELGRDGEGTTVCISHRLSTARQANLIAVLDNGRITELGDHLELMAQGNLYHEMFSLQAGGYLGAGALEPVERAG
ncbi:MAG TPA: ABC transporter ATP-binding protein [Candidatus Limnocylindria bacterium]|nr:ABC transporter ATP-binding protein [Candidatus Limnocylindria bacterium]